MTRTIQLAAAAAMSMLITGCATPEPVKQDPSLLRTTHGFVRATLPQEPAWGQRGLDLRQDRTGKTFTLYPQPEVSPSSYGFWLPAGDYRLEGLKQRDGKAYPALHVEPGRILDLGVVVALPLGGDKVLDLALPHPEAQAHLDATTRLLAAHLTDTTASRWSTEAVPAARNAEHPTQPMGLVPALIFAYADAQNRPPLKERINTATTAAQAYQMIAEAVPPLSDQPGVGPDGQRYYPAAFGRLRVRDQAGRWSSLDTGTVATIASVEVSGQRIVAGTVDGRLRISDDTGKTWRTSPADFDGLRVVDIDHVGDRWFVISGAEYRAGNGVPYTGPWRISLLEGADLDRRVPVQEVKPKALWVGPVIDGNRVRGVHPKDGSAYYINGFDSIVKVDPVTLAVSQLTQPIPAITRVNIGEDQLTLSAYLSAGTISKLSVSTDGGQTWQARTPPSKNGVDIYFDQDGVGRATRWEYGTWSNAIQLDELPRGATQWRVGPKMPPDCIRMLKDDRQAPVTCVRRDDSLVTWRDGQWMVEFSS